MEMVDPVYVHRLEQTGAATRQIAEVLAQFKSQLVEEGFSEEGAESLADTMLVVLTHE